MKNFTIISSMPYEKRDVRLTPNRTPIDRILDNQSNLN